MTNCEMLLCCPIHLSVVNERWRVCQNLMGNSLVEFAGYKLSVILLDVLARRVVVGVSFADGLRLPRNRQLAKEDENLDQS